MDWNSIYRSRVTTAEEAAKEIRSGDRVWVHPGCNTPTRLIDAMVARAPELEDVEVVHILTLADAPYADPGMKGHFRHRSLLPVVTCGPRSTRAAPISCPSICTTWR